MIQFRLDLAQVDKLDRNKFRREANCQLIQDKNIGIRYLALNKALRKQKSPFID